MHREAVIVDAVRTPFGKQGGALNDLHPQDLAAEPLTALRERNEFSPELIEDVIYGCVTPVDEQGMNIARLASMVAGWGDGVPGVQLNRMCGSGQQAVNFAAGQIQSGMHDVLIAGGTEHMSRVPMGSDGNSLTDTYFEYYDDITTQGEGAERIAEQWDISRNTVDEIAVDSQRRWADAWEAGRYDSQIAAVEIESDGERITLERDEHPRPDTTMDDLAQLPLVFRGGNGVIHAGNSSGIVDGSAALLITSAQAAREYGWEPMARIIDSHVVGVDPLTMLTGPIPATLEILEANGMTSGDIDLFEVNEAFASVISAWLEETGADWNRTNVNGGAIAHGHPLGATGAALLGKLAHELERTGQDTGLATMCIGFGQGIATIIERI